MVRGIARTLAAVGGICILAGAALAIYTAWVVVRLIEDPGSVPSLAYFADLGAAGLRSARGVFEGRQFELELGRPVYGMGMLFIGMLILLAVASLAKGLISSGINLVALALGKSFGRTNR